MMAALAILAAAAVDPSTALGRWQTETKHGVVEITRCGPSVCGRLLTSDRLRTDPALRDEKNKDPAQRQRPLRNLLILQGFHASDNGWAGGTIYNADDGGTYNATLTISERDTLKVRGCIVWPLCKSQTWKRVN